MTDNIYKTNKVNYRRSYTPQNSPEANTEFELHIDISSREQPNNKDIKNSSDTINLFKKKEK